MATPGAGKTTFALTVAAELLSRRVVDRVTIVAPTEHLKTQWADAAARAGIPIDPAYSGRKGKTSQDFVGVAVTYAGVAANPLAHRIRTERFKTLVILDEVHHAGDALSWGEAVREAFEPAHRRLALTGTPFRSDINPIPFVTYAPGHDGVPRSLADYTYGYAQALADHVVRPVLFMAYSGEMQWRTRAGDEVAARLGEPLTKDLTAQALRTALDPAGAWMPSVLAAADKRLTEVRRHVPDAGGAGDRLRPGLRPRLRRAAARRSPANGRPWCSPTRRPPPSGSRRSAESEDRWMVAVRMVSEGVDVPRLAVGVYATRTATPLFFAQAVGRFVRARQRGETASVFLPSVPNLLGFASEMEVERDHVLGRKVNDDGDIFAAEEDLLNQAQASESASGEEELMPFEALGSEALTAANQSLADEAEQRRRDQERFDSHVHEAVQCRGGIGRAQGRYDEAPGECGLRGDARRFDVTDLADEDHVGVLSQHGSQAARERQARGLVDLDLVERREDGFDRVLDRHDVDLVVVDLAERGVQRRRIAGSGGTRADHHSGGRSDEPGVAVVGLRRHSECRKLDDSARRVEDAHHTFLTEHGRRGRDSYGRDPARRSDRHPAVLGLAFGRHSSRTES